MGALLDTLEKLDPLIRRLATTNREEKANTACAIERVLRANGYDLNDLVDDLRKLACPAAATQPKSAKASRRSERRANYRKPDHAHATGEKSDAARWFDLTGELWRRGRDTLSPRDKEFLANVWRRAQAGAAPSPAQKKWIADIEAKLSRTEVHAG